MYALKALIIYVMKQPITKGVRFQYYWSIVYQLFVRDNVSFKIILEI